MDFPNGYVDKEYRGFRIRYAKDAFELSDHKVLDCTISATTPEANAAMTLTGGMPPLGWQILSGDRLDAFLKRTEAAIDEMLQAKDRAPVSYETHRGYRIAITISLARNGLWGWTAMVMTDRDPMIASGLQSSEETAREVASTRGKARVDTLIAKGVLLDLQRS